MRYHLRFIHKSFVALILVISILCNGSIIGIENGQYFQNAQTLYTLGLFKGTNNGFELTKRSTRAEAAVMLVRLLGEEENVLNASLNGHPFSDVPKWANPYIDYLYNNGLTNGISAKAYGSGQQITASQYTTMILRALNYSDQDGLYQWDKSLEFAKEIGLMTEEELTNFQPLAHNSMYRDDMVKLSYNGLFTKIKDTDIVLVESLFNRGAIEHSHLQEAMAEDTQLNETFTTITPLPTESPMPTETPIPTQTPEPISDYTEMKGVWISYLELQRLFKTYNSEAAFRDAVVSMYDNIDELGLNTVFVQVRPFADALYPSDYYPWSYIISGTEGVNPGYDPLEILIDEAHQKDLKIEAWINPFRIRLANSTTALSANNVANTWLKDGSNRVLQTKGGVIYNPANQDARDFITNGVIEIVENYNIDGIHFDDYFYPSTDLDYDSVDYNTYKSNGGVLSQPAWRRENVNIFIKQVYSAIKNINPSVAFGISPQGSMEANFNQQFIDVEKWVSNVGYIDYICPQIYYGYLHSKYPYKTVVEQWDDMIKEDTVKLYIGMAAYKIGREDKWAGSTGIREWIDGVELLKSMILDARDTDHYGGFMLYRYNYLDANNTEGVYIDQMTKEIEAMKNILE